MAYTYGTKGMPALGHAPGLPQRQSSTTVADPGGYPAVTQILRATQNVLIPAWAKYYRVSATGKGGNNYPDANLAGGGGGGGFAGTNIVKAPAGALIAIRTDPTAIVVECPGYRLSAGNGGTSTSSGVIASGGIGSGGDVNYNGGTGGMSTTSGWSGAGGGAATRGGNGGNGGSATSASNQVAGSGGPAFGWFSGGAPGGQQSAFTSVVAPAGLQALGGYGVYVGTSGSVSSNPGDGGGGAGGYTSLIAGTNGLVIVEFW